MTSGSSRNADSSADEKECACTPISRWLMRHCLRVCTNSMGSSMVRMCPFSRMLMSSIIAASVVDLPEPVFPVTRMRPLLILHRFMTASGSLSSAAVRAFEGMARNTAPMPLSWRMTLTRNRATFGMLYAKSVPSLASNRSTDSFGMISYRVALTMSAASGSAARGLSSPYWRTRAGSPAMKCRSEPFLSSTWVR